MSSQAQPGGAGRSSPLPGDRAPEGGAASSTAAGPLADDLWGIGCYDALGARHDWPIGNAEMGRDIGAASRRLGDVGIGAGDRVLFCSMLSEAGQFWPWIVGTMLGGAQLSCADATAGDAVRVAVLLRHLDFRAVIGVNEAVLDGCDERGAAYDELFAGVGVVAARPRAYERLERAGISPTRFECVGPAVAIARAPGEPAFVDADEWQLDEHDGRVLVTSLRPRVTTFDRTPVATTAHVVHDGKGITWQSAR
jgi:hypothetical protein